MDIQNGNQKESAIEFFLNKYEERQDLFYDVISKEELTNKLNSNINAVYYCFLKNSNGSFIFPTHEVFIKNDINENSKNLALAHELWHGISLNENGTGFLQIQDNKESRRFFNEGITDCLAEDLVGEKFNKDNYEIFRHTCRVLFTMVDKKLFYKDYLYGTNEVENSISQKYGQEILETYKYIVSLLDVIGTYNLEYSSLKTNTIFYDKTNSNFKNMEEAINTLDSILQDILDKTTYKELNNDER